ncbi:nucleotidyltransferase domain-containing protein [Kiritimatiella glycovorans]|uniref:Putative nucleotidyltransferase n=1 Tax=Kiritimatiella glycovorans TaxID=1307763 RepID=A0A0G3EL96_9BACT|nr:nucleotidyltransferase domain-containing protein [Kiritimatiella glycovorans]AKJ65540.1 putative nucleotidyltransferase [Kiritimatiella glycovorans]
MNTVGTIPGLDPDEMERIMSIFGSEPEVKEVILYGSRAKGTHRPGSDIDLTLKGPNLSPEILTDLMLRMDELLLPYEIDLSIYDRIDNPDLIEHIDRAGKEIVRRD